MTPPFNPTFYLTPEAIYRLTERLAIDFLGRNPTPEEWEIRAREAEGFNEPDREAVPVIYKPTNQ